MNGVNFVNVETPAQYPQNMSPANIIQGAQFRNAGGVYGYIVNGVISCLYTYPGYLNTFYLVMRSTSSVPNN
jgi:hypothetical protein